MPLIVLLERITYRPLRFSLSLVPPLVLGSAYLLSAAWLSSAALLSAWHWPRRVVHGAAVIVLVTTTAFTLAHVLRLDPERHPPVQATRWALRLRPR